METLVDNLYAEAPADRAHAASQLGALGREALPASGYLINSLADGSWLVRCQAAEALGTLGDPRATQPLIDLLADRNEDWSVRSAAARALGHLGDDRAVQPLVTVLNEMNTHIRNTAVIALGQIGGPEATAALEETARSESDTATRFAAMAALGRSESPAQPDPDPQGE